jgi:hypothetical protein
MTVALKAWQDKVCSCGTRQQLKILCTAALTLNRLYSSEGQRRSLLSTGQNSAAPFPTAVTILLAKQVELIALQDGRKKHGTH